MCLLALVAPTESSLADVSTDRHGVQRWPTADSQEAPFTVLDIHRWLSAAAPLRASSGSLTRGAAATGGLAGDLLELIAVDPPEIIAAAGCTVVVQVKIADNDTPLFGYSLAVEALPDPDATGALPVDPNACGLVLEQNLVAAYPAPLDPFFTLILPWSGGLSGGGVFVNANTADLSTVLATSGVNDVLAEIVFDVPEDALGEFEIVLGPASALSDGDGFPVPFVYLGGTIVVVPKPTVDPDYNNDGFVGGADLGVLLGDWGTCPKLPSDIDDSGLVDGGDLGVLLAAWGPAPPGSQADLNQDGTVDGADLGNVLGDWGLMVPLCADLTDDGFVDGADLGLLLGTWGLLPSC